MRRYDPDRFLITLKMPPEKRPALWALFAFNHEIAKTREVVTDTTIGLIRLQWWRDALAQIYEKDTVQPNEILTALYQAIKTFNLSREWLDALIYAREFDLQNVPPASLPGLEHYADYINTPLVRLALQITEQTEEDTVLRNIATSYSLTGLLRAVPFHAQQQRCFLPADLMARHHISETALYDLKPESSYLNITEMIAKRATDLTRTKPQSPLLQTHRRLSRLYLRQIKKLDYNVMSPHMAAPPAFFHLQFALPSLQL